MLARDLGLGPERITVLGSRRNNDFTEGRRELFDRAAQGRIDAFFLGGGQIDGQANINLVAAAGYPQSKVRFPGSFGSSHLYFLIPRVILFREEHTPRTLVETVDFISAPGASEPGAYRPGGDPPHWSPGATSSASIVTAAVSPLPASIPGAESTTSCRKPASASTCRMASRSRPRPRRIPGT